MTADEPPAAPDPVVEGAAGTPAGAAADGLGEVVSHLQAAALALVGVARTALDAAEKVALDPAPLLAAVFDLTRERPFAADPAGGGAAGSAEPASRRSRVEPIVVDVTPPVGGGDLLDP